LPLPEKQGVGSSILPLATMNLNKTTKNYFIFLILILLYVPLFKYYIFLNNNGGHSFMTADWLINYRFGYINRGLFGTLVLFLFKDSNSILNFLSIGLISTYIAIFYYLAKTLNFISQNIITYALIFSPATFLFNIYDSQGSFRKEILGILSIFLLILATRSDSDKKYIFMSSIIYTIGIFSHSVNLFFLTTILLIIFKKINSKSLFTYLLFLIPTFINFIFYFLFSNSEQELYLIRDSICLELQYLNLSNLCGYGSFDFLVWDLNAAYYITQNYIINENRQASYIYIFLYLLSILPLFFDKNSLNNLKYYLFINISFFPLFLIAFDWGRWIYIMSICNLAIYLLSEKNIVNSKFKYLLILYPFLFRIEHCCKPSMEISYSSFLRNIDYLINNFISIF
jgi:hypothetical protein